MLPLAKASEGRSDTPPSAVAPASRLLRLIMTLSVRLDSLTGLGEQGRAGVGREAAIEAAGNGRRGEARLDDLERRAVGGARFVHELAAERQAEAGFDFPVRGAGARRKTELLGPYRQRSEERRVGK